MLYITLFLVAFALVVASLIVKVRRAGRPQVDAATLAGGTVVFEARRGDGPSPWTELGDKTEARGLDLRFDHDDDPWAEATLLLPGVDRRRARSTLANRVTVTLPAELDTFHVRTAGHAFVVTLRGAGGMAGRQTRIQMLVDGQSQPLGARIENDDDDPRPAFGGWIEIERLALLRLPQ